MKACPYCAEEIQEAAIICKHCGRELGQSPTPSSVGQKPSTPPLSIGMKVLRWGMVAVALYLLAALGFGLFSGNGSSPAPLAQALRETIRLNLGAADPVEISAGGYWHSDFALPDRECTITGRVVGVAGGNKDFNAFISDDDEFHNFASSLAFRVFWQNEGSGTVSAATIGTHLRGPGRFHLVVSNRGAIILSRTVTVSASAECP